MLLWLLLRLGRMLCDWDGCHAIGDGCRAIALASRCIPFPTMPASQWQHRLIPCVDPAPRAVAVRRAHAVFSSEKIFRWSGSEDEELAVDDAQVGTRGAVVGCRQPLL